MFGLFRKDDSVKIIDRVWLSTPAKWNACVAMLKANPACLFIAWFEDTSLQLKSLLGNEAPVFLANEVNYVNGRLVMMVEHYPLAQTEQDFFKRLQLREVPVLSALDEPLFMQFGGERTVELMKKLGMGEDEILGHDLITSSIRRAQQKISRSVKVEQKAPSQEKWFALNFRN
ncbi:MAG: hypothetical protein HRU69_05015 [Flammeovirgaceae bacterium]|nr:MAG: hypothetical protein HRU69_05015 [Flammeovirgaceae bacterium]